MRNFVRAVRRCNNRGPAGRGRRDGFVLLEALVAFAILTIALAALMSGVFGAVRNDDRADFMLRATRIARSQFEALGIVSTPQSTRGAEDGLVFAMTVHFVASPPANAMSPKISAGWAHIDVTRPGDVTGKALTLGFDTFKIFSAKSEGPR